MSSEVGTEKNKKYLYKLVLKLLVYINNKLCGAGRKQQIVLCRAGQVEIFAGLPRNRTAPFCQPYF